MPPIRVLQVMPAMDAGGMETFVMNVYRTIDRENGLHREALIATGVVLFVFILLINLSVSMLNRRVHYGD